MKQKCMLSKSSLESMIGGHLTVDSRKNVQNYYPVYATPDSSKGLTNHSPLFPPPECALKIAMMIGLLGHVPQEEKPQQMVHLKREFITNRPLVFRGRLRSENGVVFSPNSAFYFGFVGSRWWEAYSPFTSKLSLGFASAWASNAEKVVYKLV